MKALYTFFLILAINPMLTAMHGAGYEYPRYRYQPQQEQYPHKYGYEKKHKVPKGKRLTPGTTASRKAKHEQAEEVVS